MAWWRWVGWGGFGWGGLGVSRWGWGWRLGWALGTWWRGGGSVAPVPVVMLTRQVADYGRESCNHCGREYGAIVV